MNEYKLEMARRHYTQGSYEASIRVLKELLADDPNSPTYHGILALNLIAQHRIYAAEYELKIALNQDPSLAFLYTTSARVCLLKNKHNIALEQCDEALALEVDNIEALLLKNTIYKHLNQHEKALSCLNHAARLEPNSCDTLTAYGEHYYDIGNRKLALEYATQALKSDPQDTDANLLMGNIQLSLNNIKEAEYHAKFTILRNPDSQAALALFANIKMHKNIVFGLWWRFNSMISNLSHLKGTMILIGAYLFFNLLARAVRDLGYLQISTAISYSWLAFVIYTWVGIPYYQRKLAKELEKFSFNSDF